MSKKKKILKQKLIDTSVELAECKKKCIELEEGKQVLSDLLYSHMMKEYEQMSREDRVFEYKKMYCIVCRFTNHCEIQLPEDILKPIPSENAWTPHKIDCKKFRFA